MTSSPIGVAVIGAGMAGRAHCAGYRSAPTLFDPPLPPIRYAAVVDANEGVAKDAATRYGYERHGTDWRELLDAEDVQVVSVVVANHLHRPIVEELLAAGKHVLCEKPLAPSIEDAQAMIAAAKATPTSSPAPASSTGASPLSPRSATCCTPSSARCRTSTAATGATTRTARRRRWRGATRAARAPALADIGSHLIDLAEFVCGPMVSVSGATFATKVTEQAVPIGTTYGHAKAELSDVVEPVENDDVATFTAHFASGAFGTFSISRIAPGHANSWPSTSWPSTARPSGTWTGPRSSP